MKHEREIQPATWWESKECRASGVYFIGSKLVFPKCDPDNCAFWRKTKTDETGEKHGICTKA